MKILIFLIGTATFAAQVPVTWSGSPTVLAQQCWGCTYGPIAPDQNAYQIDSGLDAGESIGFASSAISPDPGSSDSVETPFTLESPADVALAVEASYAAYGTSCGDSGCNQNLSAWSLDGGFSGSVSIVERGVDLLTVTFGASGSQDGDCLPGIQCSVGYSSPALALSDAESGQVLLDAGTYDLLTTYGDWDSSEGDSGARAAITETLTDPVAAVPEPDALSLVVALLGITLAGLWFSKKARKS